MILNLENGMSVCIYLTLLVQVGCDINLRVFKAKDPSLSYYLLISAGSRDTLYFPKGIRSK